MHKHHRRWSTEPPCLPRWPARGDTQRVTARTDPVDISGALLLHLMTLHTTEHLPSFPFPKHPKCPAQLCSSSWTPLIPLNTSIPSKESSLPSLRGSESTVFPHQILLAFFPLFFNQMKNKNLINMSARAKICSLGTETTPGITEELSRRHRAKISPLWGFLVTFKLLTHF